METVDKNTRRLPNWLAAWLDYTKVLPSPEIFRLWAGIGVLSAVLEQRVWVRTKGSDLFPNTYIVLVGPPGVGKSAILSIVERLLRAVNGVNGELHVAPSSLTTASLMDSLVISHRKILNPDWKDFNSMQVVASELGVFLPMYDPTLMNTLQKLYDVEPYEERRRTSVVKHVKMNSPNICILGGTTPSYLNSFLPEGAWDQGFTSRTLFIFSGEQPMPELFPEEDDAKEQEQKYCDLLHDLIVIFDDWNGKIGWTKESEVAINAWYRGGLVPVPEHGKLVHYNTRRLAHVIKLTMIMAVARGGKEIIPEDFYIAKDMILHVESLIPDIFKSMGVSGDARAIEDTWFFIYSTYQKEKRPMGEHRVVSFLKDRVPSYSIMKIIETMVRSQMLRAEIVNGLTCYIPLPKVH